MENFKARAWDRYRKTMYSFEELGRMEERNEISFHALLDGIYSEIKAHLYTGMNDRDGVEIYEGDIVEIPVKYGKGVGKVIFDEGCFKAFWDSSTHYPTKGKITGRYYLNSKAKVIGNIYENLELLKI